MWQLRRSGAVVMAGFLGMGLVAAACGARADDPSFLPSFSVLDDLTSAGVPLFHRSDAPRGDLGDPPAPEDTAGDGLWACPRLPWADALFSEGCPPESLPSVLGPAPLPCLGDLPAALAEIRAAAAGTGSWEGGNSARDALPRPEAGPAAEPTQPLLPIAPPAPDLRALLAVVALPGS